MYFFFVSLSPPSTEIHFEEVVLVYVGYKLGKDKVKHRGAICLAILIMCAVAGPDRLQLCYRAAMGVVIEPQNKVIYDRRYRNRITIFLF